MRRSLCLTAAPALAAGVLLAGLGPVSPAQADPLADAQREASRLRVQVADLRHRAAVATEEYDEAYDKLGRAVTAHVAASRALELAQDVSGAHDDLAARRVRAIYMSGGTAGLYAQVLDASTVSEVVRRVREVSIVLGQDGRGQQHAASVVADHRRAEARLAAAAAASTELQKAVATKATAVRTLVATTESLLAESDSRVLDLMAQQQRRLEEVAASRAAAALQAARATGAGVPEAFTGRSGAVLAFAHAQLGKPYLWGATGPDTYDCSGLTGAAYRAAGVRLPRTSRQQWFAGHRVELGDLQPGDLLFWADDLSDPGTIHHVSVYAGNGKMIAAPHAGDVVKLQRVYLSGYMGAVRPF